MQQDQDNREELLCNLLKQNADISMKEANAVLFEQCGKRLAPKDFSRIRKAFLQSEEAATPEVEVKKEKAPSKRKKTEKKSAKESPAVEPVQPEPETPNQQSSESPDNNSNDSEDHQENNSSPAPIWKAPGTDIPEDEDSPVESRPRHPVHLKVYVKGAESVHLAGSFNRWNLPGLELQKTGDLVWEFDGELPEGTHNYKYLVDERIWHLNFEEARFIDETGVSHRLTVPNKE